MEMSVKIAIFFTPVYLLPLQKGLPLKLGIGTGSEETRMMGYQLVEKVLR